MSWNYRVVREVHRYKDVVEHSYTIKEAFYDKLGQFNGVTKNPAVVSSTEGIAGLRAVLRCMMDALDKGVVDDKHQKI